MILFKKLILFCSAITVILVSILAITSIPTFAAEDVKFQGRTGNACNFIGFTSWDCGIKITNEDSIKTNIWKVVANIATDITVAAAYLVIGYVIYGGYRYMFSGGDPGKVAAGKKTLTQAFIGLAIVMGANVIMGAIRVALVGTSGDISQCATESSCVKAGDMVNNLINWVTAIAGLVCVIFVVYGGTSYITSAGDPGKVEKAKKTLLYSLIGLAIVGLATAITAFVSNILRDATSYTNNTTIAKEIHEIDIH